MGISVQKWLQAQGFTANPFEVWQADEEGIDNLNRYFVRPDIFDAVRGQSNAQQSVVLFAPRGAGKSALRQLVANECRNDQDHPALVVELTNYDWAKKVGSVSSEDYRLLLTRLATSHLWHTPQRIDALRDHPMHLVRLHALTHWSARRRSEYPPPLTLADEVSSQLASRLHLPADSTPQQLVEHIVAEYREGELVETLRDLVTICKIVGYSALIYTIDRVDEDDVTESNWDAALDLIKPLFNLHLLEIPNLAFKFFLPDQLQPVMRDRGVATRMPNRPRSYALTWNTEQLSTILRLRLEASSRDRFGPPRIRNFADLCDGVSDAHTWLTKASQGLPRNLIRMARMLIESHCNTTDNEGSLIRAELFEQQLAVSSTALGNEPSERAVHDAAFSSVMNVVGATSVVLSSETDEQSSSTLQQIPEPSTESIPPLRIESNGMIWLGERRIQGRISRISRLILEYLWAHRDQYVTRETLLAVIKCEPASLYKSVVRLREQLEPQLHNSKHYVEEVRGVGYRLVNFR
ncbi:hypothetical protein OSCT_0255 [Oscillochloris trichoides DG-6]|uniref:OmpR/PhoB-type domain-containing protein n=1 Tax=Oscillochloris trichoides DG-6 TaxID=765420 RepID=E1IAA4_9CHLR|nr:helix-turn-helix domain-containing protein [Oscillochloris trichoides]EFO81858.1 hypothetical protein OSCT_0255 [Oscillochloris trichoides DG-6]